jgi:DinB superfamily
MLTRKNIIAPDYVKNYIKLTKDDNLIKALTKNSKAFEKFLDKIPRSKIDFAYAEGKWTIREILQHIIDTERVFSYRAVSISRNDSTLLPGFEESLWAAHARAGSRKWKDLRNEFRALRESDEYLVRSFNEEQLLRAGKASGNDINVLAIGYNLAGHVEHHMKIITERYL